MLMLTLFTFHGALVEKKNFCKLYAKDNVYAAVVVANKHNIVQSSTFVLATKYLNLITWRICL